MKKNLPGEIIDWSGVAIIVAAYALMSFGLISSESIFYQSLNIIGALSIAIISLKKKDYEPVVLNIVWTVIAIISIIKILI
jgi:hypothetical protein